MLRFLKPTTFWGHLLGQVSGDKSVLGVTVNKDPPLILKAFYENNLHRHLVDRNKHRNVMNNWKELTKVVITSKVGEVYCNIY